jgi:hypothetical protein
VHYRLANHALIPDTVNILDSDNARIKFAPSRIGDYNQQHCSLFARSRGSSVREAASAFQGFFVGEFYSS